MQKIRLDINLADNEVLNAEIDAAIEGAVKSKTREYFYQTMEKHVNETADKCLKNWTDKGWGSTTTIERMVRERVDSTIKGEISNISVSSSDITARIDKKLDRIGEIIEAEISHRIDGIGLEDYIAKIVANEVQKVLPGKVLELLVKGLKD